MTKNNQHLVHNNIHKIMIQNFFFSSQASRWENKPMFPELWTLAEHFVCAMQSIQHSENTIISRKSEKNNYALYI
jgi:hypothetical protein